MGSVFQDVLKNRPWETRQKDFLLRERDSNSNTRCAFWQPDAKQVVRALPAILVCFLLAERSRTVALYWSNENHLAKWRKVASKGPSLTVLKCSYWNDLEITKSRVRKATFHGHLKDSFSPHQSHARQGKSSSQREDANVNSCCSLYQWFFKMSLCITSCDKKRSRYSSQPIFDLNTGI